MFRKKSYFLFILFIYLSLLIPLFSSTGDDSRQNEPRLTFLIVGGTDGVAKRFGDLNQLRALLNDEKRSACEKIFLALAEKPLSQEEIVKSVDLSTEMVRDVLTMLESLNMISEIDEKWTATLPVITDQEMAVLRKALSPLAERIAETISVFVPQINRVYEEYRLTTDPVWDRMAHLFIDNFLLDASFLRKLDNAEKERGINQHYSEKQKILPAFFLETGENFTNFGCNSYSFSEEGNNRRIFVFVLHGTLFDRIQIRVNKYGRNPDFSSALFKITPKAERTDLTLAEKEILEDLEWIKKERVLVPVLKGNIRKHLTPLFMQAAESAAEVVFENFIVILEAYEKSPYSNYLDGSGDYIQYVYHFLMYASIEELIEKGFLPTVPKPVPGYFGAFILY